MSLTELTESQIINLLSLIFCFGILGGIRIFFMIFLLGLFDRLSLISLPPDIAFLCSYFIISISFFAALFEVAIDKYKGLDCAWESFQIYIKLPLASLLLALSVSGNDISMIVLFFGIGFIITYLSYTAKFGLRILVDTNSLKNALSTIQISLIEDALIIAGLLLAFNYPQMFLAITGLLLIFITIILPKIFNGVINIVGILLNIFIIPKYLIEKKRRLKGL